MKNQYLRLSSILLLFCFLLGCDSEVKMNFLINGQDITPSQTQPADLSNSGTVLTVFTGDSIIFTDISEPEKNVKLRYWDVDGIMGWDTPNQDKKHFSTAINAEGIYEVKLCVNKEENCLSKWIKVENWGPAPLDNPVVTFVEPTELYSSSNEEYININVETENIFSKEELKLIVGEDSESFEFDEATGKLSKKVKLSRGENRIEVQAVGGEELVSEWVVVDYQRGRENGNLAERSGATSPVAKKPFVKISYPPRNFNTLGSAVALRFKTGNISDRNNIIVEVNGNTFSNFEYNVSSRIWEGDLSLNRGSNSIVVRSRDGVARDEVSVKLLENNPIAAPIISSPTGAPQVNIISPSSSASAKGKVNVSLKTKNLTGPRDLTVLLNGQKVSGIRFAQDRQVWEVQLNLKNGKNIIEAEVRNANGSAKDQVAIDYMVEKGPSNQVKTMGLSAGKYNRSCSQANVSNYTFSLTPKNSIEVLEFVVYSNICGGLEIKMQSSAGAEKAKVELIKGKNQITLSDLNASLDPGTKYTFSLKTIAGYGLCNASSSPLLEDASNCSSQAITQPEIKMDYQGKSIIYDLKYLY